MEPGAQSQLAPVLRDATGAPGAVHGKHHPGSLFQQRTRTTDRSFGVVGAVVAEQCRSAIKLVQNAPLPFVCGQGSPPRSAPEPPRRPYLRSCPTGNARRYGRARRRQARRGNSRGSPPAARRRRRRSQRRTRTPKARGPRSRVGHRDLARDRNVVNLPLGPAPVAERLEHQVDDSRRERDGGQPVLGGAATPQAAACREQRGAAEPQPRPRWRRESRRNAASSACRRRRDRRVGGHVEAVQLVRPRPRPRTATMSAAGVIARRCR